MTFTRSSLLALLFLLTGHGAAIEPALLPTLAEAHLSTLANRGCAHDRAAIFFSGTPGMGKTQVARELEARLEALRISNDEARQLLRANGVDPQAWDERAPTLRNLEVYLAYLLGYLEQHVDNRRLIFDSSLDRKYEELLVFAQRRSYDTFVIRLQLPRAIVEERLIAREDRPEYYLRHLDSWWRDYEAVPEEIVDYLLDNSGSLGDLDTELDFLVDKFMARACECS